LLTEITGASNAAFLATIAAGRAELGATAASSGATVVAKRGDLSELEPRTSQG
jgi:hypothetical protein